MIIGYISLTCAGLFIAATFIIQILAVLLKSYEPEGLLFSFLLGFPFFIFGNITSLIGLFSKIPSNKKMCSIALLIIWLPILLLFALGAVMATVSIYYKV
jgi:hypothetical protein